MNWTEIKLSTLIPKLPEIINNNFKAFQNYINVFYDESGKVLIKPLTTTGLVKASKGEFVTAVVDNLVVKKQFTNLLENVTTADLDYYTMLSGDAFVPRDPCTASGHWPYEPSTYKIVDVEKPYYKLANDASVWLMSDNLSQVTGVYFDPSTTSSDKYVVILDPCTGDSFSTDASGTYREFILVNYDPSWGPSWKPYK